MQHALQRINERKALDVVIARLNLHVVGAKLATVHLLAGNLFAPLKHGVGLVLDSLAKLLIAALHPCIGRGGANRVKRHAVVAEEECVRLALIMRRNDIHISRNLVAVDLEGKIVDILSEGVLDFLADEQKAENDISSDDGSWNRNPVKQSDKLEGKDKDVDESDLTDSDGVGDGKWCVQNSIATSHAVVHHCEVVIGNGLLHGNVKLSLRDHAVDGDGKMVEDFERKVTKRPVGLLKSLSGIALGE